MGVCTQRMERKAGIKKKEMITALATLIISDWDFKFCRASAFKESLAMLNFVVNPYGTFICSSVIQHI